MEGTVFHHDNDNTELLPPQDQVYLAVKSYYVQWRLFSVHGAASPPVCSQMSHLQCSIQHFSPVLFWLVV